MIKRKNWWTHKAAGIVFILFVCFSPVDRIDFFNGEGDFSLTVELIVSLMVCAYGLIDIVWKKGKIMIKHSCGYYVKALGLLYVFIFISVLVSQDLLLSLKRLVLITTYIFASFVFINVITIKEYDLTSILIKAIKCASVLFCIASLLDIAMWFNGGLAGTISNLFPSYNTDLSSISYFVVRPKGLTGDPNRCGIFLVVGIAALFELDKAKNKYTFIWINAVSVLMTGSRTAILCLFLWAVATFFPRIIKNALWVAYLCAFGIVFLVAVRYWPVLHTAYTVFLERILQGSQEGSASIRIELIQYGVEYAFSSIKVFFLGNGWGTSSLILTSFFSSKYGNFHNGFLSFLVESGVMSMILYAILIIRPALRNKKLIPIVLILIAANIPYQIKYEQWSWIALACIHHFSYAEARKPCTNKEALPIGKNKNAAAY